MDFDLRSAAFRRFLRECVGGISAVYKGLRLQLRYLALRSTHHARRFGAATLLATKEWVGTTARFAARHVVNGLAILAMATVAASTVLASSNLEVPFEPNSRPWVYDLSLAYLAGWIFNLLVVVLPRRRQRQALYLALRGSLYMVANSGRDLIRDLEFIGLCPERPITYQHTELVCRANNDNEHLKELIAQRLTFSRDAFVAIVPHLTVIDSDLAVALQVVQQNFLHVSLGVTSTSAHKSDAQPSDMRKASAVHTLRSDGPPIARRHTFHGWTSLIWDYYTQTERVRELLDPVFLPKRMAPNASGFREPEGVKFFYNHVLNEPGYPFGDYPAAAYSDELTPNLARKLAEGAGSDSFLNSMRVSPSTPEAPA